MTFVESATTCVKDKYFDFNGRAGRSEYWWFVLFMFVAQIVGSIVHAALGGLIGLALFLPALGVGARRLHDIGKTGWLQLVYLIPLIGFILWIYWCVQPTTAGSNEYGEAPAATPE